MKILSSIFVCFYSLMSTSAWAWTPSQPIKVLIGFAPGSGNELIFRSLAAEVEKNTGAKFVIMTKPGAGGAIASKQLTQEKPDGHTVSVVISKGIPVQDKINIPDQKNRGYSIDDFTYLMVPAVNQFAIIANSKDSINGPKDLINALTREPMTFVAGGGSRLVYEVLKESIKFKDVVHLLDNGPVQAINEIIGGHARIAVVPLLVAGNYHKNGNIKIVATTGTNRAIPGIGTVSEAVPGFEVMTGWGIVAPKGLPNDVQNWYIREFGKALQSESVKTFWNNNFLETPSTKMLSSSGYFDYVKTNESRYAKIVDTVVKDIQKKQ